MALHWVAHVKRNRSDCMKNEKESSNPSSFLTPAQIASEVGVFVGCRTQPKICVKIVWLHLCKQKKSLTKMGEVICLRQLELCL